MSRLVVVEYLKSHGITPIIKESAGRTIYKVPCPFDQAHGSNGESAIIQRDDGLLTFECKHASCSSRQWRDYRETIGRPAATHYNPPLQNTKPGKTNGDTRGSEQAAGPPTFATSLLSSSDFDQQKYKLEFLVDNVLVAGQPCVVGGRSKACKTSVAIDLVVSLGSGTPFLNHFATKRSRVAFWSGESGGATIQSKARRAAEARGVTLPGCDVHWSFDLPKLGQSRHVEAMANIVLARGLDVIVIDPLYLSLLDGSEAGRPGDLFYMGSKLLPLSELGQRTGVTIVLLHHFRKAAGGASGGGDDEQVALEELSMSGTAEWARQWLLLARREPFNHDGIHKLWMRAGGSAGHAGLYGVDIDEGTIDEHFDGRKWEVDVRAGGEVLQVGREERAKAKAEKQRADDDAGQKIIIDVLHGLGRGNGVFIGGLQSQTGMGKPRTQKLLAQLLDQKIIEPCSALRSSTHKTPQEGAYRLTDEWWQDV